MKSKKEMELKILAVVQAGDYRPVKPKLIARKLKLDESGERELKRSLKELVKRGEIAWGPKHLVLQGARKPKQNEIRGVFRKAAAGFGFVTPLDSKSADRSDDIYIPRHKTEDAADGDTVRIRVSRRRQGPELRIRGRILEVIERRTHRFVGTYTEKRRRGLVMVDNGVFDTPILVGDAGAKNCRVGDKVVIEVANFPSAHGDGEGVIVEVLGDRGKPGVDTLTVIREFDLPEDFPAAVMEASRQQADQFDESVPGERTDFTGTTVITIDPKTARDFDDAISLEQLENGHWRLGVHIADVSHFVPERSALDDEAYARGTSVYLPDRVIPMLPELISNNLASLQPDRVRYTMTAVIEFDPAGVPIATDLHRGVIKSAHRFNYAEIDDYLANDKPWKKSLTPPVFQLVRQMHTLAMILRKRRLAHGAIELSLPDVRIDLDDDGKVAGAHVEENTESHQIIEEFMLAANEAVAREFADREIYFMRRVHEAPSPVKLKDLTSFIQQIGIECDSLESRFEIKRVVELAAERPEAKAIHFAVLRSMQKAVYSPRESGHYALASDAYCHFTSPIRRYPDLVIHRMLLALIEGKKPRYSFDRLAALGHHCSSMEQRAEQAERELTKLKLLNYFADRVGEEMEAVISGVEPFGLFAQGVEIPVEGLIPIANLPDDSYQYERSARTLSGYHSENQYRLGDRVVVCVAFVDTTHRQLEFRLSKVIQQASRPRGRKGQKSAVKSSSRGRARNRSDDRQKAGKKKKSGLTRKSKIRKGKSKVKKRGAKNKTTSSRASQPARKKKNRKTVSKKKKSGRK
ncbi:MAG: ribonuclease R [Planctomycetota bacterium]|nr:ribonuclease R [Planctomycetota bacterium]